MKITIPLTVCYRGILIVVISILLAIKVNAQASCATAPALAPSTTCTTTLGNLLNATNAAPTGTCGGATATTTFGVWYKFTAASTSSTVTISGLGTSLTAATTYVQVFSGGVCGRLTSIACQNVGSALNVTGLTIGSVYYVRIYVTANPNVGTAPKWAFGICIQNPPAND